MQTELASATSPPADVRVRLPAALAWLAYAVLVFGVSPAVFWLDSGEIAAAGFELGVLHPPGTPGLTLLLRFATLVPLGSLGFRMGLLSAAFAAATVGGCAFVLRRHHAPPSVIVFGCAWLLGAWTFVRQAKVIELYAFAGALALVALVGLVGEVPANLRDRVRLLGIWAASWAVWCFGDLRLALAPLAIGVWIMGWRRGAAWTRLAPLLAMHGTLVLAALPLSSLRNPRSDWGNPERFDTLWAHLQATSIRTAFAHEILPSSLAMWRLRAEAVFMRMAEDASPLGPVLVVVALAWLARRGARQRALGMALAWVWVVEFVYAAGINPMGGPDRQTGYVTAIVGVLAVSLQLVAWLPTLRTRVAVLPLLSSMLVGPVWWTSRHDVTITRSWMPHRWTRDVLDAMPVGTLLLTQSDDLSSGIAAARVLEGARPDVTTIVAQHLHKPLAQFDRRNPQLVLAWEAASQGRNETQRIEAVIASAEGRPVALELPRSGVFAHTRWWSEQGVLPVRIDLGSVARSRAGRSLEDTVFPQLTTRALEAWLTRWQHDASDAEGRRRLAEALAGDARGRLTVHGDAAVGVSKALLRAVVERIHPEHASSWVTLGVLEARGGDFSRAITFTRRALEIDPGRPAALDNLARQLSRSPQTQAEALELARTAVRLRPHDVEAWNLMLAVCGEVRDVACIAEARAHRARLTGVPTAGDVLGEHGREAAT